VVWLFLIGLKVKLMLNRFSPKDLPSAIQKG
jgi:hypothetical protein